MKSPRAKLRSVWAGMVGRCHNPRHAAFPRYGGLGIQVCREWHDFDAFYRWAVDGYAAGLQIDRREPTDNYSPEACRWVTPFEQQLNKRIRKTTSRFVGVRRHSTGLFEARIWANGKRVHLGYHRREEDAGAAYRYAVKRFHGKELADVICRY